MPELTSLIFLPNAMDTDPIMNMKRLRSSLILSATLMSMSPALADTDLILCNKSAGNISIAVAYQNAKTGRWMMSAWHNRAPSECKAFDRVKTGLFYYHAKNEKGAVWPAKASADRSYCVPDSAVNRDMESSACAPTDARRDFKSRAITAEKFTFNFE
jgi:uncharacterized membrane protein